jgi:hypothetical protein
LGRAPPAAARIAEGVTLAVIAANPDILAPGADEAYQLTTYGAVWGDRFKILIARTGETVLGRRHRRRS